MTEVKSGSAHANCARPRAGGKTAEAEFAQMRSNGSNEVPGSIVRWHGRRSSELTTEYLTGRSVPLSISPRRRGDPAMVAADHSGARAILGGGPHGPGLALHGVLACGAVAGWMVHLDLT
jgi:hypothetical protein